MPVLNVRGGSAQRLLQGAAHPLALRHAVALSRLAEPRIELRRDQHL
jgi:hypothetical protein